MRKSVSSSASVRQRILKGGDEADMWSLCFRV